MSKVYPEDDQSFFQRALLLHNELRQLLQSYTHRNVDTQDLLQDTYFRFITCEPPATLDPASVRAFCRETAKNIALNWLHRRNLVSIRAADDDYLLNIADERPHSEQVVNAYQELDQVVSTIESLPPQCREVFKRRRVYQEPAKKVANDLNISTNTVNTHLQKGDRSLRTLAKTLARAGIERLRKWHRRGKQS